MALTSIDYALWRGLRDDGLLPEHPHVLEFGEANWYGDVDPSQLAADVDKYADPRESEQLLAQLSRAVDEQDLFATARVFYRAFLHPSDMVAVDLHGTLAALRQDLNEPLSLPLEHYDVLINSGTAEHVFDQRRVWQSAHVHTKPNGLMVHAMPLHGWLDHGFVNYHPTFVADVAAANGYEILRWWYAEIDTARVVAVTKPEDFREIAKRFGTGISAMQYVVFRKPEGGARFQVPMQGYYAGRLDEAGQRAWKEER